MLQLKNISKKYNNKIIFDNLNLTINPGDFLVIIGDSGEGKTTFLKLLLGSASPDKGDIIIDWLTINNLTGSNLQNYRRQIGFVFQDFKLLPKKTVAENIAFVMESFNYSDQKIKNRITELLNYFGLQNTAHVLPTNLSGGEQQRVAIARAIANKPQLLLLDEPTGNLDINNIAIITDFLLKINAKEKTTIIITTHNPITLQKINKTVYELKNGQISLRPFHKLKKQ